MKRHRTLWLAVVVVLLILTALIGCPDAGFSCVAVADAAPAGTEPVPPPPERISLVQVSIATPGDLGLFEQTGLPAYTHLEGREAGYLLAGVNPASLDALAAAGLSVRIIDPDMAGATYYLAYPAPNRPRPEWGAYGQLLLDDGEQALLRTTPQDAERLSLTGAELRLLTLTPKPLRPTAAPEAIPAVIQPDPLIQAMIDQVDGDTAYYYDRQFSGEVPVWVDGAWYTISSRYNYSGTPIQKTTHWVGQHMANLGLDVEYHQWGGATYPNVIGELTGLTNPDDIFIIGGHVDDVQGTKGADDNASGSVATLVAADILSQYEWGCTLRFALWTGEEQGMNGSAAYAQRAYYNGENIVGYLDPDMIAWNTTGSSPGIDLRYNSGMPATLQLARLYADVVSAYGLSLVPQLVNSGGGFSDHSSFWDYGYTAILAIEDNSDYNPYYHTSGDTPAHLNRAYFTEFVKASVATFAHMSGCLIPGATGALDGHVTTAGSGAPIAGAMVVAQDAMGKTYSVAADATGYYTQTLWSGTYTLTAEAFGYLPAGVAGVEIVADEVTTRDFALETAPHYTISGHVTELGTGLPLLAELQFEGSPVTVWTDPADGYYEALLPPGSYTIRVQAGGHLSQERPVVVTGGDQIQDFSLEARACTLLVDDDIGADYETYYQDALAAAGQDYELWTVATAGSPTASDLAGYDRVVWLTGTDTTTTLTTEDQAALTSYLNGGGKLFISGQDIGYDIGTTPFYANYLHAVYDSDDTNNYSLTGLDYLSGVGLYIAGGDGAGNQTWPSDISPIGGAVAVLDYPSPHLYGGVAYQNGTYGVVYFSFGFEAIDNQADRAEVMLRTLEWLGGCECEAVHDANFTRQPTHPHVGEPVRFDGTAAGQEPIDFAWDFGDETTGHGPVVTHSYAVSGTFTVVLTAANSCGTAAVAHDVMVRWPWEKLYVYLPIVAKMCSHVQIQDVTTGNDDLAVTFASTVSGQEPVSYLWSFGDGITSTLASPIHIYPGHGTYTATLEVSNCDGQGSDSWTGVVVLVPEIGLFPLSLEAALYPGEVTTVTLWLTNTGVVDLSFVLHETGTFDLPWLAETPTAGVLAPGQAISLAVTYDAGGLEPGVYTGLLDVESDDPETPHVGVPVTLTVERLQVYYEVDILAVVKRNRPAG